MMGWQEWCVAIIGLVVFVLTARWLLQALCGKGQNGCGGCGRNCPLRRKNK